MHFGIHLFTLHDLNKNIVNFRVKKFVLGMKVTIFKFKTISFENGLIELILYASEAVLGLLYSFCLLFVATNDVIELICRRV